MGKEGWWLRHRQTWRRAAWLAALSHPDFTVGPGTTPGLPPERLAGFTADRELAPCASPCPEGSMTPPLS